MCAGWSTDDPQFSQILVTLLAMGKVCLIKMLMLNFAF